MIPFRIPLFVALAVLNHQLMAQSPGEIAEGYRKASRQACEKIDQILQSQGARIVAERAANGDKDGANRVAAQIEGKLKGEPISAPDAAIVQLLVQYDSARMQALLPIQKSTLQKIDRALKDAAKGDIKAGVELAVLRNEVERGRIIESVQPIAAGIPMKWDYFSSSEMSGRMGILTLNEDGTLVLDGHTITQGKWKLTKNSTLDVTLFPGDKEEKAKIIIQGNTALFERPFGTRYLKAHQ